MTTCGLFQINVCINHPNFFQAKTITNLFSSYTRPIIKKACHVCQGIELLFDSFQEKEPFVPHDVQYLISAGNNPIMGYRATYN